MRDQCVEGGRGTHVLVCQCCSCKKSTRAGDLVEFCEPCLQVVKQCPPKKRFTRGAGSMKPRPIIVKPANSIALDRLVEVALSPTGLDATKSTEFPSPSKVGDDPGVVKSDGEVPAMESPYFKKKPTVVSMYSLPLETDQKLKRLSSFHENSPRPRSSKAVHGVRSKKFTPRFKPLLDISC